MYLGPVPLWVQHSSRELRVDGRHIASQENWHSVESRWGVPVWEDASGGLARERVKPGLVCFPATDIAFTGRVPSPVCVGHS